MPWDSSLFGTQSVQVGLVGMGLFPARMRCPFVNLGALAFTEFVSFRFKEEPAQKVSLFIPSEGFVGRGGRKD